MLPIGSMVYLREGTNKLMNLNRGPIFEQNGLKYNPILNPQKE